MTTSNSFTWTARGKTSNWNNPANWSAGGPPGATDIAYFTGVDTSITGNASVGAIVCEGAQTDAFYGSLNVLGVAGEAFAVTVAANAQVVFEAGADLLAPTLGVGVLSGSSTLTLLGSSLYTTTTTIGSGSGAGLVAVAGGFWGDSGNITIGAGHSGIGDLSLDAGATLDTGRTGPGASKGNLLLGVGRGAQGVLSVAGGARLNIYNGNMVVGGNLTAAEHGIGQVEVGAQGSVSVAGTLSVNAGSSLALADGTVGAGVLMAAAGSTIGGSGELSAGTIINDTVIMAQGSLIVADTSIGGSGTLALATDATLTLYSAQTQAAIDFLGPDATLRLEESPDVMGTITGFAPGDFLENFHTTRVSFDASSGVLTLYHNQAVQATLSLAGNYGGDVFGVYQDGSFGVITVKEG